MKNVKRRSLMLFVILFFAISSGFCINGYEDRHGWLEMKAPASIVVCAPGNGKAEMMLLESLSGLAAKAVNEGRSDMMVWIDTDNESYRKIFSGSVSALKIGEIRRMDVWQLLDIMLDAGIVKGYVYYTLCEERTQVIEDYSANVATVYSHLLDAVMIDSSLVAKAESKGLRRLKDATHETTAQLFAAQKHLLNNNSALNIHPSVVNMRDYAIAHGLMLYADEMDVAEKILEWVEPLSPIVGWCCGDEYRFTALVSEWGHYNTASDWCTNLPFISAAAPYIEVKKAKDISPSDIDFSDSSYVHSFVMSDGDNMQWTMGNFIDNPLYMGHPQQAVSGISWTVCPVSLSVVSPVTWNGIVDRQCGGTLIEYGGGYQYPDLFAVKRDNRPELLRIFAKRVNRLMKKTGVTVFGVICRDVYSEASKEAFSIYAEELEGIDGIIAIQYFPYETGNRVQWFSDSRGGKIPVLSAAYALWNDTSPGRPCCGAPEYISSLVNRDMALAGKDERYSFTIVHAWSDFAESSRITAKPATGVSPVLAAREIMDSRIRIVSLKELLLRIRKSYLKSL